MPDINNQILRYKRIQYICHLLLYLIFATINLRVDGINVDIYNYNYYYWKITHLQYLM